MRKEFYYVAAFLVAIWLVYIVDTIIPYPLTSWGIHPRRFVGLVGIALMPFLHANFFHIFSNTISLAMLLGLLVGSRDRPWPIVAALVLVGGGLLWVVGRDANHVGASGLVFGLIAFLIASGILEKKLLPIVIALLVGFLFGGTLLWGIVPRIGSEVSWDGHLCGAIGGAAIAYTPPPLTQRPDSASLSSSGSSTPTDEL